MRAPEPTPWFFRCGDVVFPLREGERIIGRASSAEVTLDDHLVSREHAELEVSADTVFLRDLGSRNGVYLRTRKLDEGERVELADGDAVIVGRTTLVLMKERSRGKKVTLEANAPSARLRPPGSTSATGIGLPYLSFLDEADRAAAREDFVRLETATHVALQMLTNAVKGGLDHEDPAIERVVAHALTLAEERGKGWIERLFVLYAAGSIVIPVDVLTTVGDLVGRIGLASRAPIAAYVGAMRPTLEADARGRALLTELLRIMSL